MPFGREEMQLSFAPLVKQTAPAVVNVYASQTAKRRQSPFAGDPFFEQFFGRQAPAARAKSSLGSGVLVDPGGIVVTNFHVIRDADEVKVATVGRPRVRQQGAAQGRVARSRRAEDRIGEAVSGHCHRRFRRAARSATSLLAIGNPFGVGQTTTSGIVSALARSHIGVSDFGFFIQTDAAINPGNSGGALINMSGQLVGINTAIYSRSGGSIGIGFAIPSNMVRAVVECGAKRQRLLRAALYRRRLRAGDRRRSPSRSACSCRPARWSHGGCVVVPRARPVLSRAMSYWR